MGRASRRKAERRFQRSRELPPLVRHSNVVGASKTVHKGLAFEGGGWQASCHVQVRDLQPTDAEVTCKRCAQFSEGASALESVGAALLALSIRRYRAERSLETHRLAGTLDRDRPKGESDG